jgi:hypothetical protein
MAWVNIKKYVSVGIILLLFLVIFSSGCTSNGNTTSNTTKYEDQTPPAETKAVETHPVKSYSLNSSTFNLTTIWETEMKGGMDSILFTSKDFYTSSYGVWQLLDKEAFVSERKGVFNSPDPSFVIMESKNITIDNTTVEVIKWENPTQIFNAGLIYFFEKNNKFYKLVINTKTKSELDNTNLIDMTINDTVSTMT